MLICQKELHVEEKQRKNEVTKTSLLITGVAVG